MAEGLRFRVGDDVTYGLRLRLHGNRLIWRSVALEGNQIVREGNMWAE